MEASSLTPSVWAPPSTGSGLVEGIGVLTRTPYAVAEAVGAIPSTTKLALLKKPSMGVPMAVKTSLAVG